MPKKPRFSMVKIPRSFSRIYFGVKVNRSKKEKEEAWKIGQVFNPVELVKKTNLNIRRIFDVRKYE